MFFKKERLSDGDICYMFEYLPKNRFLDGSGPDIRSKEIIWGLKDGDHDVIEFLADKIGPMLDNHVALVAVPSSKVEKNGKAGTHQLIREIVRKYGEQRYIIDASSCLYRFKDMPAQHEMKGQQRDKSILYNTLEVRNAELINGRDVIIIDDVTTSGNSLEVSIDLVKRQGAHKVIGLAIGKTVSRKNNHLGFIFDLDQTLFDTSSIEMDRKAKDWDSACKKAKFLHPYDGIIELIDRLRSLGIKICIVTSSPREYASILAKKIGISTEMVISYNDTTQHKPAVEPYFRAKQRLGIFEQCIVVVGDSNNDIIPGAELGMTTVMAGWGQSGDDNNANFFFKSPMELLKHLPKVLTNAEQLKEILDR